MELISYLKADHKNIRRIIKDLDQAEDREQKLQAFFELDQLVDAHFKAEESAVYAASLKKNNQALNEMAVRGFEEHNLFDDLAYKIKFTNNFDLWPSQVKVFCQILDMHLTEEENEFFPVLNQHFNSVELDRAAVLYLKIKKSEQSKILLTKKRKRDEKIHTPHH
ncbi:MAG: hemerythrin domain-containing protein [Bdellovibrionaceae bacterium]|nr:hemerythrin domain-containing protein [Bdellovibrio sp.]